MKNEKIVYVYEDHIYGDYYILHHELKYDELYCDVCNDSDQLILSGFPSEIIKNEKRINKMQIDFKKLKEALNNIK